jgi:hypothetical protein
MTAPSPRAAARTFPTMPLLRDVTDWKEAARFIESAIQLIMNGKLNVTGTVTLSANQTTTTVTDTRAGSNSFIYLMPTTANAGGELGWWISARDKQEFTVTHANDSRSDRTFTYIVLG